MFNWKLKRTIQWQETKIEALTWEKEALELQIAVLEQVLNVLPEAWVFLISDIQKWIIEISNAVWKALVKKATWVSVKDWETSIHQFHKRPEQSKWVLWKMKDWETNKNATLRIWDVTIKSTSHKFTIWWKEYFVWIFTDWTAERKEIESLDFVRENIEQLLSIFLSYSNLWVSFKILVKDLEEARDWVKEHKSSINYTLEFIKERFEKTNKLFWEITTANQDVANIFQGLWLIALNWRIEAARQWEHWRWFAVVAEETMKTASKSESFMKSTISIVENWIEEQKIEWEKVSLRIREILENDSIEKMVETRVQQSETSLKELVSWIWRVVETWTNMSRNLKWLYNEKLTWSERIRRVLKTTKLDHLLFIIKLNTFLTTESWRIEFTDHEACDLWKTLAIKEIQETFKENQDFIRLLEFHKQVHFLVKELKTKIDKDKWKNWISKEKLEEISLVVRWELLRLVNETLRLIDKLANEI